MEDNIPCIMIKFCQPEVSRKRGRPRLKWLDSISKKYLGSELMVEKSGNRELWSANIIDAKTNKGLKHQTKEEDFQTLSL